MRGPQKVAVFQIQVIVQERHNETRKKKKKCRESQIKWSATKRKDPCEGEYFNTRDIKDNFA